MNQDRRELLVNRILSGQVRCNKYTALGKDTYIIKTPTNDIKYEASEIYEEALRRASFYEIMNEDRLETYLIRNKLWTPEKQVRLDDLPKEIEDLKVNIFECLNNAVQRTKHREDLAAKKQAIEELYIEKHSFDYLTCSGFASYIKSKFILSNTVYKNGGRFHFDSDAVFDGLLHMIGTARISEKDYREIARTDPWRGYWNLSKTQNLFGFSISEYTDEQRNLCSWSRMYDNIYESNESPHDSVIEDDDMLDGWMIAQRRKREKDQSKKDGDELVGNNDKIRNATEVYVMCKTEYDIWGVPLTNDTRDSQTKAKKVDSLNDAYANMVKKQRLNVLKEKGVVNEIDMPDVKLDLMTAVNKMFVDKVKG
jgi:hypothetical protein